MKKKKITIKQKIGLIFLGVFIALVLLEFSLRVGGYVIISMQRAGNKIEDGEYVILCLGESTTAELLNGQGSWPQELEKILDERSSKKVKVINGGVIGISITEILMLLNENLEKYNPNIIITMIGINDDETTNPNNDFINFKIGLLLKKTGKMIGFLVGYFLFTTILYFILILTNKMPTSRSYIPIVEITILVSLVGYGVKRFLR